MHEYSYDLMKKMVEQHLAKDKELGILDVGSLDINGCYKPIFAVNPKWHYIGADAQPGPNVDVVLDWDYKWSVIADGSCDAVISGQTLEHMKAPWLAAKAMERVCKRGGICIIIVPCKMDYHPYPLDCWRIFPDGMRYIMTELASFEEIECGMRAYQLTRVGVADTVFVGRKR